MARARNRLRSDRRRQDLAGVILLTLAGTVAVSIGLATYFLWPAALDPVTNCPKDGPSSLTLVLLDLTDPLTPAQRQALHNHFERIRDRIVPVHGSLELFAVEDMGGKLLSPKLIRCKPERSPDVPGAEVTRNERRLEKKWHEQYQVPFDKALNETADVASAARSPILEAIQSVALTSLLTPTHRDMPRLLIVVSDFLQNTKDVSFYRSIPDAQTFLASPSFLKVKADLSGVDVVLLQIDRTDAQAPVGLMILWKAILHAEGAGVCVDSLMNFKGATDELDCEGAS